MATTSKLIIPLSTITLALFTAAIFFFPSPAFFSSSLSSFDLSRAQPYSTTFRSPKQNVWAELSEYEAEELYEYLHQTSTGLNLTRTPSGSDSENYIALVEALLPNKTDVIDYLHGSAKAPQRWARVVIAEANATHAQKVNYMVGPLPPTDETDLIPLSYCYNSGRHYIDDPLPSLSVLFDKIVELTVDAADITEDLLGKSFNGNLSDPDTLGANARISRTEQGSIVVWCQLYFKGISSGAQSILPQGIYFKVNAPNRDLTTWFVSQWYYNGHLYSSIKAFRAAWESPDFVKLRPNSDGEWTTIEDFDSDPEGRSLPPPLPIQPQGPRYSLSRKDKYISYFGWTFYLTTSSATGLAIFDIRFQGERVMYSLGLQEALAHYAGSDPFQGGLEFLDTAFKGMGSRSFSLVPGYDCPAYADYLDLSHYLDGDIQTNKDAICVFEFTADYPLQRHAHPPRATVSRNTYLTLRSVPTVGNYDYTIDYMFYLDGTIEVKVRASGFIWGAFFPDVPDPSTNLSSHAEHEYSYRIHDALMSSMHDHVLSFRADFDVAGEENTLYRVGIEPTTKTYDWDVPEQAGPRRTMHLTHEAITTETNLTWPRNSGAMFVVLNNASTNAWGEQRGYRIAPGTGVGTPAHLTITNSSALGRSAAWSTADLFVLRAHDTEPRTTSELNMWDPWNPLVDFAAYLDGENTTQQDLVVLFNLGTHHVPTSSDIPNTLMHTSASGVLFIPHNFVDRDPSRATSQGVRVDKGGDVQYYGAPYTKNVKVDRLDLEPDLTGYMSGKPPKWVAQEEMWGWKGAVLGLGNRFGFGTAGGMPGKGERVQELELSREKV